MENQKRRYAHRHYDLHLPEHSREELNAFRAAVGVEPLAPPRNRRCLSCDKTFLSHSAANRICPTCSFDNGQVGAGLAHEDVTYPATVDIERPRKKKEYQCGA